MQKGNYQQMPRWFIYLINKTMQKKGKNAVNAFL